ncbi:ankyrin repeat domain-containing protein [Acinetobacter sp. ANC 4558]|uniref:ankyrin repeat domain-containing protein n=1 Tax=Acinetobacter sp. ANC 4558 TaxID=1977876 RepID=UPI001BB465A9|nr:ankyrin repeat domain-containing protein [Acinetobacter sp. ANC 4558]
MMMKKTLFFATILIVNGITISCYSEANSAAQISTQSNKNMTNPFNLIVTNNIPEVSSYIQQSGDLNIRNSRGETLLMNAIYQNKDEIAKLLIHAGADVNAQDQMKNSPFLYAGAEGKIELVKLMLNHQPDFKIYNRYGGTALIPAAEKGHVETVRLLANTKNYPINYVNSLGWTALMEAVVLGDGGHDQAEIIKILLDAGADKTIPDKNNVSALTHAQRRGFHQIVELLK